MREYWLHRKIGMIGAILLALAPSALPARMLTVDPVFEPYAERTEYSVKRALAFLLRSQKEDGSFPGAQGDTAGVVALAGMSFLAAGFTPNSTTPEGAAVTRCMTYCIGHQKTGTGYIEDGGRMYSHCAATLFLSEISGMVDPEQQERLKPVLASAVKLILSAQAVKKKNPLNQGGWRYYPTSDDSDMSLTGWAIMSLRSARLNGAPVPDAALRGAMLYVRNQEVSKGGFRYDVDRNATMNMAGAALLCMELCGMHGQEVTIRTGDWGMSNGFANLANGSWREYGAYYWAQATFQLGAKYWKSYADWFYPYWLGCQVEDGSWPAGSDVSPVYSTSMIVLALTVPYRQLPIYQRDETVDEF